MTGPGDSQVPLSDTISAIISARIHMAPSLEREASWWPRDSAWTETGADSVIIFFSRYFFCFVTTWVSLGQVAGDVSPPHCSAGKTEDQRGRATCCKSHRQQGAEARLRSGFHPLPDTEGRLHPKMLIQDTSLRGSTQRPGLACNAL